MKSELGSGGSGSEKASRRRQESGGLVAECVLAWEAEGKPTLVTVARATCAKALGKRDGVCSMSEY